MNITAREPIAVRELRQAARQRRVPVLLAALPLAATLVSLLVASAMSSASDRAAIGAAVFEGFFAFATCVVVVAGATVAASGVASEREGHTFEALVLSGLSPAAIARGKFLSAFAQSALYLLAVAPGAGLAFLFGGVTVTELAVAFVLLLAVAALAVVFGLAVSSYARTGRGALAGALIATLIVGPSMYALYCGAGLAVADMMGRDPRGATWLARAIATAPFGARSFVFFVLDPILVLAVPGWFVFEVTKANLADPSDDRSTGVRRWYIVGTSLLVAGAGATILATTSQRTPLTMGLLFLLSLHLGLSALVFGGEPLGPSRRVMARWERTGGTPLLRRLLGPGVAGATVVHAMVGSAALAGVWAIGRVLTTDGELLDTLALAAGYAITFHLLVAGATGALAVRFGRPALVRGIVAAGAAFFAIAPLAAGAFLRVVMPDGGWRLLQSLSPFFLLTGSAERDLDTAIDATLAISVYGFAGILLVVLTPLLARRRRCG